MHLDPSDEETAALTQELHDIVENDRYPFSPRIRTLRAILNKLRPEPAREPCQYGKGIAAPVTEASCGRIKLVASSCTSSRRAGCSTARSAGSAHSMHRSLEWLAARHQRPVPLPGICRQSAARTGEAGIPDRGEQVPSAKRKRRPTRGPSIHWRQHRADFRSIRRGLRLVTAPPPRIRHGPAAGLYEITLFASTTSAR
jgi:hypothetical protein